MPKQPMGMSRYEITFPTEEEIRQERERWLQGAKAFIFPCLGSSVKDMFGVLRSANELHRHVQLICGGFCLCSRVLSVFS
jgi:hypothetical protein